MWRVNSVTGKSLVLKQSETLLDLDISTSQQCIIQVSYLEAPGVLEYLV